MKKERVLLAEGKTKKIWTFPQRGDLVCIENRPQITAFDDPKFTREFAKKAEYATTTTCRVFELLKAAGIPVAYEEQFSSVAFLAPRCEMIPLEIVARRYAVGSYLSRNPQLRGIESDPPHRFHRLVAEFFLKTTKGKLVDQGGQLLTEGLDPKKGEEDPFILCPDLTSWYLYHPKKPIWEKGADLGKHIWAPHVIGETPIGDFEDLLRETFLVLEGAWAQLGYRLIDMKIEFGLTDSGKLIIADVIDNDSWRLRNQNWQELSKQAFRDGEELSEVERKYGTVANLVQQFRIPHQALVLWRGSEKDDFPKLPDNLNSAGSSVDQITISGHKSPQKSLNQLEEILAKYPDGGVIIVKVGMSNGLGPILAARTSWPVISVPASAKDFPEDVWSSLRMPSDVPMTTILNEANAINHALNILTQKNPLLYMQRQKRIEELDV